MTWQARSPVQRRDARWPTQRSQITAATLLAPVVRPAGPSVKSARPGQRGV